MKPPILFLILLLSLVTYSQECKPRHPEFQQLPEPEKVALWNAHLRNVLNSGELPVTNKRLNPEQKQILVKWIEVLQPGFFTFLQGDPNLETGLGQKVAARLQQTKDSFTPEDGQAIFQTLPEFERDLMATCGCSPTWTFCGFGSECSTASTCTEIIDCGPFWQFLCSGICREIPQNDLIPTRKKTE